MVTAAAPPTIYKSIHVPGGTQIKSAGDGRVRALFSVFNTVDSDGDVLLPGAFAERQEVPMVWSHDWADPIGKGTVHVTDGGAEFDGRFFLDTDSGVEAFKKVRAMGDLQEWSYGFRIPPGAAEDGEFEGRPVRFIGKRPIELFEVSPVLVGANRATQTLAIKSGLRSAVQTAPGMNRDWLADADRKLAAALAREEERRQEPSRAVAKFCAFDLMLYLNLAPVTVRWVAANGSCKAYINSSDLTAIHIVGKKMGDELDAVDSVCHEIFHLLVARGHLSLERGLDEEVAAQMFGQMGARAYMAAGHSDHKLWIHYFAQLSPILSGLATIRRRPY